MRLLWRNKQPQLENANVDVDCHSEVDALKKEAHKSIAQADKSAKRLNALLKANGITLQINIATGGHNGR